MKEAFSKRGTEERRRPGPGGKLREKCSCMLREMVLVEESQKEVDLDSKWTLRKVEDRSEVEACPSVGAMAACTNLLRPCGWPGVRSARLRGRHRFWEGMEEQEEAVFGCRRKVHARKWCRRKAEDSNHANVPAFQIMKAI